MARASVKKLSHDELALELDRLEKKYRMSSREFYERFTRGELGDSEELMRWAALYEAALSVGVKELVEA